MLNCCVDLEEVSTFLFVITSHHQTIIDYLTTFFLKVKETGISFDTFACLAKCQGLKVQATRADDSSLDKFRQIVKQICITPEDSNCTHPISFLVVSYTRKVLGQTGTGHFSPIGAYDEATDKVLLLDTARFKYGPHWVDVELMFKALEPIDPSTGKSRGYVVLSYDCVESERTDCCSKVSTEHLAHLPLSLMFKPKNVSISVKEYKQFVQEQRKRSNQGEIDLQSVISYWTKDYTSDTFIQDLVMPQLRPVDMDELKMVESIQKLTKTIIKSLDPNMLELNMTTNGRSCDPATNAECCNASSQKLSLRYLQISPIVTLTLVYVASLSKEARDQLAEKIMKDNNECDPAVMEQLMSEVSLISFAIETSDMEV